MAEYDPQALMRSKARELLASGQVRCVIGYEKGSRGQVRPAFIHKVDDANRLVWNQGCTHNLVTYLRGKMHEIGSGEAPNRIAIVVKPCDSRALNVLLSEKQILREQLYVIGVVCEGIVEGAGFAGQRSDTLQTRCLRCNDRVPVVYDLLIGEPLQVEIRDDFADVTALEAMSPAERASFWLKQFLPTWGER